MQKLHHKGMGPPLTGNNGGSPLSNNQNMGGFGSPASHGMVSIPTQTIMSNPAHMTPEVGPVGLSNSDGLRSLFLSDVQLQAVDAKASLHRNEITFGGTTTTTTSTTLSTTVLRESVWA